MHSWNSTFLFLGLCLGSMTKARKEKLHKPSLWAMPSPTLPVGSPVSIRCRGPPGARVYYLEKSGRPEFLLKSRQPWPRNEVSLSISGVTPLNAGTYRCSYQFLARWSELSDALELEVTGVPPSPPSFLPRKWDTSPSLESTTESPLTFEPEPIVWNGSTVSSGPETMTGPIRQDYLVPNIFRLGLVGLVVVILGILLAWPAWRNALPHPPQTLSPSQEANSLFGFHSCHPEDDGWGMSAHPYYTIEESKGHLHPIPCQL